MKIKPKNKKEGFLGMLLDTLGASLLRRKRYVMYVC